MNRKALFVVFGVGIVGIAGAARAADWLGTSGVTNDNKKEAHAPANMALRGLILREQSDKPYRLTMSFYSTLDVTHNERKEVATNEADPIGTFDTGSVDLGTGVYATAIQVCTNKKAKEDRERIKGVRLWGGTINKDGSIAQNATPKGFAHPNCAEWHAKVSCDAKSVITNVRAYYGDKGFSGLQVACSVPAPPK